MLRHIILPTFLAIVLSGITARATPVDFTQDLQPRHNRYNLNCSNAPEVTAGLLVNQSNTVLNPTLPESGSNQAWMKYLWCTVGTQTYTFFDFGPVDPYPQIYTNFYEAYAQAAIEVRDQRYQHGDGPIAPNYWFSYPPNTGVAVFAQNHKGTLTWGILQSAIEGLRDASLNFNKANYPMVFEISDGGWGTVGIGGAGILVGQGADRQCVYEITAEGGSKPCLDIENGKVID